MLYHGDNLPILKGMASNTIDLVYLDPPFATGRDFGAFDDRWTWGGVERDVPAIATLHRLLGPCALLAYLVMMAVRLVELHRVLKPTGSLYLHCDPTASHYLKIILDTIFNPRNFRNEIVWKRTSARSDSHRWNHIHDTLLFYTKSDDYVWNTQYTPYSHEYVEKFYHFVEPETGRKYASDNLTASGTRNGSSGESWHDIDVRAKGIHWKYTLEGLEELDKKGRIVWPNKIGGVPRYKRYLDEMPGVAIQSVIADIPPLSAQSAEKLGYPTQKPLALLERIIAASSNPGDVVLDPFCGCGTAVAAAEKLDRRWIGIDSGADAVRCTSERMGVFC